MSELRFNPITGEWVATATHRQDRIFLPPAGFCPLCPTEPEGFPTEIPEPNYDIVVFENRFPSLSSNPPPPAIEGTELFPVRPSKGVCEVVVYTPNHNSSLAVEPVEQILNLVRVWKRRFEVLDALDFVKYVFIFENKGEAVGVTLHHPHGQIYAYPFVPPVLSKEVERSHSYFDRTGRCVFCDVMNEEINDERRIVAENEAFAAFIPFYARYPYETHIYSKRHISSIMEMTGDEEIAFAAILKQILSAFDRLFNVSFPYIMSMHQRPSEPGHREHSHFHVEFYPPMRTATKLKFLAGSEAGAGVYINDTLPEVTAAQLKGLVEPVRWQS